MGFPETNKMSFGGSEQPPPLPSKCKYRRAVPWCRRSQDNVTFTSNGRPLVAPTGLYEHNGYIVGERLGAPVTQENVTFTSNGTPRTSSPTMFVLT